MAEILHVPVVRYVVLGVLTVVVVVMLFRSKSTRNRNRKDLKSPKD